MSKEITFSYKAKGTPLEKPRVFFTCHPDDFERCFEKISDDILGVCDCVICYTDDMTVDLSNENNLVDLERMNLYIIPITFDLLTKPNRAIDEDVPFATEKHIPILPFLMDSGIEELYAKQKELGELHYLNPFSYDSSAKSYEDKLRTFLHLTLINNEAAQKVRAAFDAHIFLSYRKKDRKLANELMRMIHSNPNCRDVAIWFDEFLTPGESFTKNIEIKITESDLFVLLVTPNLLETPNYILTVEYPYAKKAEKMILPVEMEKTNPRELSHLFADLPVLVDAEKGGELSELLTNLFPPKSAHKEDNPEHLFLIGLAYLEGFDVEVNVDRGIKLITSAANAGFPEAMKHMLFMYRMGHKVKIDYHQAAMWAEKLVEFYAEEKGEEASETLFFLDQLALIYGDLGYDEKALELSIRNYESFCRVLGKDHPETLKALNTMAHFYSAVGFYEKALECLQTAFEPICEIYGVTHPFTLVFLNNLAEAYAAAKVFIQALYFHKFTYGLRCSVLGEEHPDTLFSLHNLACAYADCGQYEQSLEASIKVYQLRCKVLGETHPQTLISLDNLPSAYADCGQYETSLELSKKTPALFTQVLGEEHPKTIQAIKNLVNAYCLNKQFGNALDLAKKLYLLQCKVFGKDHPDTVYTQKLMEYLKNHLG